MLFILLIGLVIKNVESIQYPPYLYNIPILIISDKWAIIIYPFINLLSIIVGNLIYLSKWYFVNIYTVWFTLLLMIELMHNLTIGGAWLIPWYHKTQIGQLVEIFFSVLLNIYIY